MVMEALRKKGFTIGGHKSAWLADLAQEPTAQTTPNQTSGKPNAAQN